MSAEEVAVHVTALVLRATLRAAQLRRDKMSAFSERPLRLQAMILPGAPCLLLSDRDTMAKDP